MNLPVRFLEVEVDSLNGKTIGNGILDTKSESNCLFLFLEDHVYQYTKDEVIETFQLFNPKDGFKYDLTKVLL